MHATIRRYESIDQSRKSELVKKVDENLLPTLSELPGFNGYSLIDAGDGVMTSVGFFDTAAQADESTRIAGSWLREQKLDAVLQHAAEDHERRRRRAQDGRARPGLTASSTSVAQRRPAHAGLLRAAGNLDPRSRTVSRTSHEKGAVMALKPPRTQRARTVGHISHDARVRVDQRVKEILARRDAEVERARRAARRLKGR